MTRNLMVCTCVGAAVFLMGSVDMQDSVPVVGGTVGGLLGKGVNAIGDSVGGGLGDAITAIGVVLMGMGKK